MELGRYLAKITTAASMALAASAALASPFQQGPLEMDLDNWTRLYCNQPNGCAVGGGVVVPNGQPIPIQAAPALGYESRAFIGVGDIGKTLGLAGPDLAPYWIGGLTDGTYLWGVERNVTISQIYVQGDGSVNIYFDHVTSNPLDSRYWEVELWQTGIDGVTWFTDPNYLAAGPGAFNTIYANMTAGATGLLRGRFTTSTYADPVGGSVNAVVGINIPSSLLGGVWLNQNDLIVDIPFILAANAFIDVDPFFGVGGTFNPSVYGPNRDLLLNNVRLNSEALVYLNGSWIVSDDGVRGVVPEPGSILLLGAALMGAGLMGRRRRV